MSPVWRPRGPASLEPRVQEGARCKAGLARGRQPAMRRTLNFLAATKRLQDATGAFEGGQYRDPIVYGVLSGGTDCGRLGRGRRPSGREEEGGLGLCVGTELSAGRAIKRRMPSWVPRRWVCCWMVRIWEECFGGRLVPLCVCAVWVARQTPRRRCGSVGFRRGRSWRNKSA